MIHMITEHCRIDHKPIEKSWSYRVIRRLLGKEIAAQLTYEVVSPAVKKDEPDPNP